MEVVVKPPRQTHLCLGVFRGSAAPGGQSVSSLAFSKVHLGFLKRNNNNMNTVLRCSRKAS